MEQKADGGMDHRLWEEKGRGVAVFRCVAAQPLQNLAALPGTSVVTHRDMAPSLGGGRRVILKDYPERFFFQTEELQRLINQILLPAYRQRIPVYFFTECAQDFFVAGELPFGGQDDLAESLRQLAREQVRTLIAQMCILFPSPDAVAMADGPPMTPIEKMLAKAMKQLGLNFTPQVPIGPYLADFVLTSPEGHTFCVEADGRDFHEVGRDNARDAALMRDHGVAHVLRFTGSKIWHNPLLCAQQVAECLQRVRQNHALITARLPAPRPSLSKEQETCLNPQEGVVLTLAPAGSGKTRVLTRRVVEAVRSGIAPERVLCVVFNRHAKQVMEQRIHQESGLPSVTIRTLHSMGYEIARQAPDTKYAGYRLADDETLPGGVQKLFQEAIRADIIEQARLRNEEPPRRLYVSDELVEAHEQYVSIFKKTLVAVGEPMDIESVPGFNVQQAARVAAKVEEELAKRRLMTFDDQIFRGVETLLASPKARVRYQQQFDVVLVDEFQDLTPVQFLLVRLLALPLNNLFAVGDDDQMINSFAGADPRNLREFSTLFRDAVVHTLGENHRCAPTIVRRSANVISYNLERFPKNIRPARRDAALTEPPDTYRLVEAGTPTAEALEAVTALRQWHEGGIGFGDMAVLVRVSNVASFVQIALKSAGIPFVPLEKARFFTSLVGKTIGAYLNLIRNPDIARPDHLALAISTPPRFIGRDLLDELCEDGWSQLASLARVPPHAKDEVRKFCARIERLNRYSLSADVSSSDVVTDLIRQLGLAEYYQKEDRNQANTSISSSAELLGMIQRVASDHPDFDRFVDWYNEQTRQEMSAGKVTPTDENKDKVRVLTIHSCKGAEFRAVVLFHVTEGILPHAQALATNLQAALEEERRVFYVGMTRAIDRLLITTERGRPSRFTQELDQPRPEPRPFDPREFADPSARHAASRTQESGAPKEQPKSLLGSIFRFLCDLFGVR